MELAEIIRQRIQQEGPISFHDFMEMALYYPGLGYYSSEGDKIGKSGDFYTSSSLTPVFGAMIGKQLEEMWRIMGAGDFTIVEFGAGTGMLCHDILNYAKDNPAFYNSIHYAIIEKSDSLRQRQQAAPGEKVSWYTSIDELGEISGCILSNELVDNFAVHQVVMEEKLMEVFVDYNNGFTEVLRPANDVLHRYFNELKVTLPEGYRTEINLQATKWIKNMASHLKKGYVITVDYGYLSEDLYKPRRSRGTLLCYYKHRVNEQFYQNIGKQDITAHINFSALVHWGAKGGLESCGLTSQANFLLALGFKEHLRKMAAPGEDVARLAIQEVMLTRTLLIEMGDTFKVLIQQKGMPPHKLTGLRALDQASPC